MEIISQQACEKCTCLDKCVDTAMYHPEKQIRCVHFGYVKRQMDEFINELINIPEEYLLLDKERMN